MTRDSDPIDVFVERLAQLPPEVRPELEVEALVDRIHALSRRFRRQMERSLQERGLAVSDLGILTRLRLEPGHRTSPSALSRSTELTPGAITNRLNGLVRLGYVRRLRDSGDRRAVIVELTEEGRATWDHLIGTHGREEARIAASLTTAEQRQLNDLLRKLMLGFGPW